MSVFDLCLSDMCLCFDVICRQGRGEGTHTYFASTAAGEPPVLKSASKRKGEVSSTSTKWKYGVMHHHQGGGTQEGSERENILVQAATQKPCSLWG